MKFFINLFLKHPLERSYKWIFFLMSTRLGIFVQFLVGN
jgi:hypothetical protein